jgi:2-polyprenyl-3-methyl-5-hydroxy-6-metoxy-1,4-benzoquinol methylase
MTPETQQILAIISPIFSAAMFGIVLKLNADHKKNLEDRQKNIEEKYSNKIEAQKDYNIFLEQKLKFNDEKNPTNDFNGEGRGDPNADRNHYKIIKRKNVEEFYNLVANKYNRRNRGPYGQTYEKIYQLTAKYASKASSLRICDLGGGTGWLLQKFTRLKPFWLNIDFSQNAINVFEEFYRSYPNKEYRNCDLRNDGFLEKSEQYDIFIINFLISSMDGYPKFKHIYNAMHKNSILVFADNHFSYVTKNPMYGFDNVDGENLAIEPVAMHREFILNLFKKNGFVHIDEEYVVIDGTDIYSQIHVFKKFERENNGK